VYLDSAYLAKFYLNEPDSIAVRTSISQARKRVSSIWVIPEMICVFHRHVREGSISATQANALLQRFLGHIDDGIWNLVPVTFLPESSCAREMPSISLLRPIDASSRSGQTTATYWRRPLTSA
jgi:predicted nucleic acid-binding protein